nr:STAS-like domain-containing protein [uncultured Vibrio sp.]
MIIINVAVDFSRTPFGRYPSDGDYSAQKFREEILRPEITKAARSGEKIEIDFSKVALGVGSSFLEEAFGGLVRSGVDKSLLLNTVTIKDRMSMYDKQVKHFIEVADSCESH